MVNSVSAQVDAANLDKLIRSYDMFYHATLPYYACSTRDGDRFVVEIFAIVATVATAIGWQSELFKLTQESDDNSNII